MLGGVEGRGRPREEGDRYSGLGAGDHGLGGMC